MHTDRVSTVLPGTPAPPAQGGPDDDRADPADGSTATGTAPPGRLARWPAPVRVPLQVLGQTLAKA